MTDWTSGYVADIGYTFGYYTELNPLRARLAFLNAGLVAPTSGVHCELGFGQGMSINVHAAASGTTWYGTDFNPAQAGFAQELAAVSGANAHLVDQPFAEFCRRTDLPDFDSIGLHGIWSWISDENRAVIVDFLHRKLKVGGVLYISYNTQPGWAAMAPMRDLLAQHVATLGAGGQNIVTRIDAALDFAGKLIATNPAYARANPQVAARLDKIRTQDRNYLAHEYFNRDWLPMPFARMAEWLAPAKLDYACSAHYLDHIDAINLSTEQQKLISEIPDRMFRETVRDFCVNQQFRRDYWVRGARKLNVLEQAEAMRAQRVILVQPRANVSLKVNAALGEASMQEALYNPILDMLADHQPKSLGQIEQAVAGQASFAQIWQAMMILTGNGAVLPVTEGTVSPQNRAQNDKLNAYIIDKSRGNGELAYLSSPLTGGAIPVGRFQQLFLLGRSQGKTTPADMAMFVWQHLSVQAQKLVKDGRTLETAEENLAELRLQATAFNERNLPMLMALQIAKRAK